MISERLRKLQIISEFYYPWIGVWFYPGCAPDTRLEPYDKNNETYMIISKSGNKFWNLVEL